MKEKSLKHLSFGSLLDKFRSVINVSQTVDSRDPTKTQYEISDAVISGFACMYFQDPSLLYFQRRMEEEQERSNLKTIFGVKNIPKDTQFRTVLDKFDPECFAPVFKDYFLRLQRGKHLEQYRFLGKHYLLTMDGTQYFCSENICCDHCLETTTKRGENEVVHHSHQVLQVALVHPDIKQVIPLMPEEISNTDGSTKQDCEWNAAKRQIERLRSEHAQLDIILVGDGLFSKQPMIEHVLDKRMHFIFVAKPDDHKHLMEYVNRSDELQEKRFSTAKQTFVYRWLNDAPLNAREDAYGVNYFSVTIYKKTDQGEEIQTYRNSWVTDLTVNEDNVDDFVKAGRARWKIENECFNTLKNQGYRIEHNYGHGSENLCYNFYLLILLAFTSHQIFDLTDGLYQACRKKAGTWRFLWERLRGVIAIILFDSWEDLLRAYLNPPRYGIVSAPGP